MDSELIPRKNKNSKSLWSEFWCLNVCVSAYFSRMSCGRLDGISLKFTVLPVENFQVFDIFKRPKHRVTVNPYPWILDKKIQILRNKLASFLEIKSNKNSRDLILEIELASFLEKKSIFPYMIYLHNFLVVTVMFMTSLCWWLYDGDWFQMLVAESLCWRLFSLCWLFSQCIKSVTNIGKKVVKHLKWVTIIKSST